VGEAWKNIQDRAPFRAKKNELYLNASLSSFQLEMTIKLRSRSLVDIQVVLQVDFQVADSSEFLLANNTQEAFQFCPFSSRTRNL